jgi:hypothetical protein
MFFVEPGGKTRDAIVLKKLLMKIANEPGNVQTRAAIQKQSRLFVARLTKANQLHLQRSPSLLASETPPEARRCQYPKHCRESSIFIQMIKLAAAQSGHALFGGSGKGNLDKASKVMDL